MHPPPPLPTEDPPSVPTSNGQSIRPHQRGSGFGGVWDSTCRAMLQSVHHTH